MRYPILIKKLGHFRRNHVSIVGNRHERNSLARLSFGIGGRDRWFRFFCIGHNGLSIHQTLVVRVIQMLPGRSVQGTQFGMPCR